VTEPGAAQQIAFSYNDDARSNTVTFPGGYQQITNTDKSGKTSLIRVLDQNGAEQRRLDYDYDTEDASGTRRPRPAAARPATTSATA
jgi:hypothetical protein